MKGTRMWGVAAIVALAGFGVGVADVQAQTTRTDELAAQLEQEASQLMTEISGLEKASALFREAAQLRGDHPAAVQNLRTAGKLSFTAGQPKDAMADLMKAADLALKQGDGATAAESLLDAAWVAEQQGDGKVSGDLVARARRIVRSPLVAASDRARLEARIRG